MTFEVVFDTARPIKWHYRLCLERMGPCLELRSDLGQPGKLSLAKSVAVLAGSVSKS
jgi:hypothetical protein